MKKTSLLKKILAASIGTALLANMTIPVFAESTVNMLGAEEIILKENTDIANDEIRKVIDDAEIKYVFEGQDRIFDGNRVVDGTKQDKEILKSMNKGSIIIRYRAEKPKQSGKSRNVLFAAGKNNAVNNFGAISSLSDGTKGNIRVDFPGGMKANLMQTETTNNGDWHTFIYSVNGVTPHGNISGSKKTVTSFDANSHTQYPDWAVWYNYNLGGALVSDIEHFSIGGYSGGDLPTEISSPSNNFRGEIAFVAITDELFTQQEADALTKPITYQAQRPNITKNLSNTVDANTVTRLEVEASVDQLGQLTYQWYKNGMVINGATTPYIDIDGRGRYMVAITNTLDGFMSKTALSNECVVEYPKGETRLFTSGDSVGSNNFRIPFLWTTTEGTVIAGTDARHSGGGDSPANIDVGIRRKEVENYSQNAIDGWDEGFIPDAMNLRDYPDKYGSSKSASFIDGMIVQDQMGKGVKDRILIQIDGFAWNGGIMSTGLGPAVGDGFATIDGKKYLLLSSKNIKTSDGKNNNKDRKKFDYVADIYGEKDANGRYSIYHLNGVPRAYSGDTIDDTNLSLGELSNYSLNQRYELFKDDEALTVAQRSTNIPVPMNMLYEGSELQVYNTSYIYQFYSDDDGVTWEVDKIITGMVKTLSSTYYITGPGRGIQLKNNPDPEKQGRLIFPIYFNKGGETTGTIYSDDGGNTWQASKSHVPRNGVYSEAQLVELPDGTLQIYMRSNNSPGGLVVYSTSKDGGETWSNTVSALGDAGNGSRCQLSVINYSKKVMYNSQEYDAILMSSVGRTGVRDNGTVRVGLVQPDNKIKWISKYEITKKGEAYAYSCLTELENGKIGLLYESTGTTNMHYEEFTIGDLMAGNV